MTVINQFDVLNEVIMSLRNADVLTTTQRDVNRVTQTGTLVNDDEIVIDKPNVKNIKSLIVDSVVVSVYDVDFDSNDECVITLPGSMSGVYTLVYDYGVDKIFVGYPRSDLTINSFPRIAVEYIDVQSQSGGFGNVNRNKHDLSIVVYSTNKAQIRNIINLVRVWCVENQNALKQLRLIKPVMMGPLVIAGEFAKYKDKIMKQNFDFAGLLSYEVNN